MLLSSRMCGFVLLISLWTSIAVGQDNSRIPLDEIVPFQVAPRDVAPIDETIQTRLRAARDAFRQGRLVESAQVLDELRDGPGGDSFEVNLELALVNEAFQFPNEALDSVLRALTVRPGDVKANVLAGRLYLSKGDRQKAIAHLRAATLATDEQASLGEATLAWQLLAEALTGEGYRLAACEAWEAFDLTIWETFPEHRNYQPIALFLGRHKQGGFEFRQTLLEQLGASDRLVSLVEEALRRDPRNEELQRMRVQVLRDAGRTVDAFEVARQQLERGDLVTLLPGAVDAAVAAEQLDTWVDEILVDLDQAPQRALARALLRTLNQRGDATARRIAEALVKTDPGDVEAAVGLFAAQVDAGDSLEGLRILTRMFRAAPDLYLAERYRRLIEARRRGSLVAVELDALQAEEADDFATQYVQGLLALGRGDQDSARMFFGTARSQEEGFAPAYLSEGLLLLQSYEWEACIALAETLQGAKRRSPTVSYLLGAAYSGLDRNDEAEAAFRKAIERDPAEPAYSLALADHCRRLGNQRCAQRFYRESFLLNGNELAFEGLIEAYLRDGKRAVAEAEVARLAENLISPDARRRVETMIRYLDQPFSETHVDALAEQLAAHPDDVLTMRMFAAGLFANAHPELALEWMRRAHALQPDDYELTLELAQMYRMRTDFQKAAEVLTPLMERYPNRLQVLRRYSTDLLADFQWDTGLQAMRRLAELETDGKELRLRQLLVLCLESGRIELGEQVLDELVTLLEAEDPDAVTGLRLDYLYSQGHDGAAYQLARKWWSEQPNDALRRERLYNAALRMEDYDWLAKKLADWADAGTSGSYWVERLVLVHVANKDYAAAREVANTMDGSFEDQVIRRTLLGQIAAESGDSVGAAREFEALLDERAVSFDRRHNIWDIWIDGLTRNGAYDAALELCDRWEQTGGRSVRVFAQAKRAGVLQAAGRDREQIPILEERYRRGAGDAGINNDLGYTWADQGWYLDEARAMTGYAVAVDPLNSAYLDSFGWVAYKQGRLPDAAKWLERAIQLRSGRDATLHDHLGDTYWRLHRFADAENAWKCAVQIMDEDGGLSPRDMRLRQVLRRKLQATKEGATPPLAPMGEE